MLILEHARWSMVEKYQALTAELTVDELMEFSRSFRAELFAEGLVQGNLCSAVSAVFVADRLPLLSLPVHYPVLCFLHRRRCASCSMSQSKAAIPLNPLPDEKPKTTQSNRSACCHLHSLQILQ